MSHMASERHRPRQGTREARALWRKWCLWGAGRLNTWLETGIARQEERKPWRWLWGGGAQENKNHRQARIYGEKRRR